MSQYSGYSTASKQALALKDKEMAAKDEAAKLSLAIKDKALEEKNEKMLRMQIQLDEMAKRMNSISTPQTRGRGRPRGGGGGGLVPRGGRGSRPSAKMDPGAEVINPSMERDFTVGSQAGTLSTTRAKRQSTTSIGAAFADLMVIPERSQSKKRNCTTMNASPEKSKKLDKFWSTNDGGVGAEAIDGDNSGGDPRDSEEWKIAKRKGFLKDRENKTLQNSRKQAKIKVSKTARRNSKESEERGLDRESEPPQNQEQVVVTSTIETQKAVAAQATTIRPVSGDDLVEENEDVEQMEVGSKGDQGVMHPLMHNISQNPIDKCLAWSSIAAKNLGNTIHEKYQEPTNEINQRENNTPAVGPQTLQDIIVANNDGAWREEIEIELRGENGEAFTGTITMQEAKHGIYRDCLEFRDFTNFDGIRFGYKGIRMVTFKLKEQINVDNLIEKQNFTFKRTFRRNGKTETVNINCKIRGLRSTALKEHIARKDSIKAGALPDGSVMVKLSGCEYKLTGERLKEALEHWGELTTEIKEEVFVDPHDKDGTNRTGVYVVRMRMDNELPELIPIDGLRVKCQYHTVKKLCTSCYGKHLRKNCKEEKISWFDYIRNFRDENPDIPDDFYGESLHKSRRMKPFKGPELEDFNVPRTEEEWNQMISKMKECGIDRATAAEIIRKNKEKYDAAVTEFTNKYQK